jgi:predicted N-formylglutamate amidohydrolase
MTKISISEAIKLTGISRSHFYKTYINKGIITIDILENKKLIDMSELIRVFGANLKYSPQEQTHTLKQPTKIQPATDKLIEILEQQIRDFKTREEWLQKQIDELRNTQHNILENKSKRKKFLWMF